MLSATARGKEFSMRQRVAEPSNILQGQRDHNEESRQQHIQRFNCNNGEVSHPVIITAASKHPTRPQTSLLGNKSAGGEKEILINTTAEEIVEERISASDKDILAHLAKLDMRSTSAATSLCGVQSGHSQPSCSRCSHPIYPQELVKPNEDQCFHSSCFKCNECGLRLSLTTFYRNPLSKKDAHIFCRAHTPKSTVWPPPGSQITDPIPAEIVKGDLIGLRYF